jgi:hypothetical protein
MIFTTYDKLLVLSLLGILASGNIQAMEDGALSYKVLENEWASQYEEAAESSDDDYWSDSDEKYAGLVEEFENREALKSQQKSKNKAKKSRISDREKTQQKKLAQLGYDSSEPKKTKEETQIELFNIIKTEAELRYELQDAIDRIDKLVQQQKLQESFLPSQNLKNETEEVAISPSQNMTLVSQDKQFSAEDHTYLQELQQGVEELTQLIKETKSIEEDIERALSAVEVITPPIGATQPAENNDEDDSLGDVVRATNEAATEVRSEIEATRTSIDKLRGTLATLDIDATIDGITTVEYDNLKTELEYALAYEIKHLAMLQQHLDRVISVIREGLNTDDRPVETKPVAKSKRERENPHLSVRKGRINFREAAKRRAATKDEQSNNASQSVMSMQFVVTLNQQDENKETNIVQPVQKVTTPLVTTKVMTEQELLAADRIRIDKQIADELERQQMRQSRHAVSTPPSNDSSGSAKPKEIPTEAFIAATIMYQINKVGKQPAGKKAKKDKREVAKSQEKLVVKQRAESPSQKLFVDLGAPTRVAQAVVIEQVVRTLSFASASDGPPVGGAPINNANDRISIDDLDDWFTKSADGVVINNGNVEEVQNQPAAGQQLKPFGWLTASWKRTSGVVAGLVGMFVGAKIINSRPTCDSLQPTKCLKQQFLNYFTNKEYATAYHFLKEHRYTIGFWLEEEKIAFEKMVKAAVAQLMEDRKVYDESWLGSWYHNKHEGVYWYITRIWELITSDFKVYLVNDHSNLKAAIVNGDIKIAEQMVNSAVWTPEHKQALCTALKQRESEERDTSRQQRIRNMHESNLACSSK